MKQKIANNYLSWSIKLHSVLRKTLALIGVGLLSTTQSAWAATIFEKINTIGEGAKSTKEAWMVFSLILGIISVIGGILHIKKANKSEQHSGSNGPGFVAIIIGVILICLWAFIKMMTDTVGLETDFG